MVTIELTTRQFELVKEMVHTNYQLADQDEYEEIRELEVLMEELRRGRSRNGTGNFKG